MEQYVVYVRVDEQNRITEIQSSAFLASADGWIKIDSGFGDRYYHAQGNYLEKQLYDERCICRYKLVDGQPVERTQDEMDADDSGIEPSPSLETRVSILEEKVDGEMSDQREALNLLGIYA